MPTAKTTLNPANGQLKNLLAMEVAIRRPHHVASQTPRQTSDLQSANRASSARLTALGDAMHVLTAGSWEAADLRSLIVKALSAHGTIGERIHLSVPDLTLQPQVSLTFALALEELATNAAKYGALPLPEGYVTLAWPFLMEPLTGFRVSTFTGRNRGAPVSPPSLT